MFRLGSVITVCCLVMLLHPKAAAADDPVYDELSIYLNIQGLGGADIDAVIKGRNAYLSLNAVFDLLKIKNATAEDRNTITGFYIRQQDLYQVSVLSNTIVLAGKTYKLDNEGLIRTSNGIYLKTDYFGKVFSLDCAFDFSTLSVNMKPGLELPVLLEKKRELLRKNLSGLRMEKLADTTVQRSYRSFNLGSADWALSSTQMGSYRRTLASLQLGAVVAGGEAVVGLNYVDQSPFNIRQQYYKWRYVDNTNNMLRQVTLGKIPVQSISSLIGGVIGIQLTNASTMLRRAQGTYTLSNTTKPDWIVELYINDVLVDYKKADAAGFFSFQVPEVYGTSIVKLRFLGPYGEEQFQEQQVTVPYNFLPKGEFEYTISNGMVADGFQSRFSRTDLKYGQSSHLTIGGGLEYLSKVSDKPYMPFLNASYRLTSSLFLSAEHALNVRTKANLSYRLPNSFMLEADYTRFRQGQQAVIFSFLENRKISISRQFRKNGLSMYTRLAVSQLEYEVNTQTYADLLLSFMWHGLSANCTTYASLSAHTDVVVNSTVALSSRLPFKMTIRPQAQYSYYTQTLNSYRVELEKQLGNRGFLNIAFDHNLIYKTKSLNVGVRFDLSFVRSAFSVTTNKYQTSTTQSVSGGVVFDKKAQYLEFNNRSNVGRAGLIIYPYLDLNSNNKRDKNEPKIMGLQLKMNGGRLVNSVKDTTVRVTELEPFTDYLLEVNPASFDNIAWQIKNKTYKVTAEPSQLKLVEIPVQVFGEISGKVLLSGKESMPVERISVGVYQRSGKLIKSMLTDSEGYFDFLGLPVGSYTLRLDPAQLEKLKLKNLSTSAVDFIIRPTIEGDVVSNADFKLQK
jgi:hypothetical protein